MSRVPTIFSAARRATVRRRRRAAQQHPGAPRFLIEGMVEDVLERLAFLRHESRRALVVGDWTGELASALERQGTEVVRADPAPAEVESGIDEEAPYPFGEFDLIASLATLDTVNDLPGALIHVRNALSPGGRAIVTFPGAGSLPVLRRIMLGADGERPAPRAHPMVDARAGAELLQRAGWADPVADSYTVRVAYRSLDRLVGDLRAQGLSSVLASSGPPLGKAGLERARAAFAEAADDLGRVIESFEIVTLSGRRA